jgi:hypothetical protein
MANYKLRRRSVGVSTQYGKKKLRNPVLFFATTPQQPGMDSYAKRVISSEWPAPTALSRGGKKRNYFSGNSRPCSRHPTQGGNDRPGGEFEHPRIALSVGKRVRLEE